MRTTIVPAQMTTVEDRIAGNLNFTQIFLLVTALLYPNSIGMQMFRQEGFENYRLGEF